MKIFYRRRLPHLQPSNANLFLTYNLAGSLPKRVLLKKKEEHERQIFDLLDRYGGDAKAASTELKILKEAYQEKFQKYLDQALSGPKWLITPEVAEVIKTSLHFIERDLHYWTIWAYSVMPNHIHLNCTLEPGAPPLHEIMRRHKNFTAHQCNRLLDRTGHFWHYETFDRLIRDENDFYQKIYYTLNNPVKARLAHNWWEWPHNYCHPEVRKELG